METQEIISVWCDECDTPAFLMHYVNGDVSILNCECEEDFYLPADLFTEEAE